jgi:folate-binding protein YgfZ
MTWRTGLPERGVIEVTGADRVAFLQGLVSNDVAAAAPGRAVWAALLTPQGKWLDDFFIFAAGERLLLDCERARVPEIVQRLSRYRLRADVQIAPVAMHVGAAADPVADMPVAAPDPRLPEAGWRFLSTTDVVTDDTAPDSVADWDLHRLRLGLPDGSRDLEREKSVLLEAGFDELGGVSWTKGCYMGQELTARTKYRGLVKRRLVPVHVEGVTPPPGTPVMRDGAEVGTMRSARETSGLALLRLDALGERLRCGSAMLAPVVPGWMRVPQEAAPV